MIFRFLRVAIPVVALVVSVSSCAAGPPPAPAAAVDVPPPPTTAAPAVGQSERGLLIKRPGDVAQFGVTQDALTVKFVVDKITVDPKCSGGAAQQAENGHLVKLDLRAETTPELPASSNFYIVGGDWSVVGPDGVTESEVWTMPAASCLPSKQLFPSDPLSPASKYRGSIILDTRSASGVAMFRPGFMSDHGGWEWSFPA